MIIAPGGGGDDEGEEGSLATFVLLLLEASGLKTNTCYCIKPVGKPVSLK